MSGNRPHFVQQLLEIWSRLLWAQRVSILVFGLLGLALVGSVVYFMNRVEYQALYRDLNAEDARAIAAKLEEEKMDYRVQGTSILVAAPKSEIDKLRLDISGSGLARSGRIGYEIFDKNQFGMTDFTEQVNLQRALEGELARTITSLSEIAEARVHIVLPKKSIFEEGQEEAKASVVLTLKNGAELSKASVSGIKGVVAGAVPGLHKHNVSIVDGGGAVLAQSAESGDTARAEMETGIREQLEKEMSGKVVSILEPLVGKGKVHANASIALDFNTTEQTEETYNPNPPVILSQQRSEERSGIAGGASGVPGTQSNLGMSPVSAGGTATERVRQSEVTNYEVNKLVRHTIQPKGMVRRVSVAVILDHKTVYDRAGDGTAASRRVPRTPQEIDAYRQLVLAAIGYDAARGDVVSIENVPFYAESRPETPAPEAPWYLKRQVVLMPAMKYGSLLVLFLIVYFVLLRPVRQKAIEAFSYAAIGPGAAGSAVLAAPDHAGRGLPGPERKEELAAPVAASAPGLPAAEPRAAEASLPLETVSDEQIERELIKEAQIADLGGRKFAVMKKKLADKAKKDPELMSQLIRTMLRERM